MEEDRTGSVGVKQAAMTKAVAISTLNIKAAKREQTNQPKVITIAGIELALLCLYPTARLENDQEPRRRFVCVKEDVAKLMMERSAQGL